MGELDKGLLRTMGEIIGKGVPVLESPFDFNSSLEMNIERQFLRGVDKVRFKLDIPLDYNGNLKDDVQPMIKLGESMGYSVRLVSELPSDARCTTAIDKVYYLEFTKKS